MKVIIIDEDESVRLNLESLLAGQSGNKIVFSTSSLEEAREYLSRNCRVPLTISSDIPEPSDNPAAAPGGPPIPPSINARQEIQGQATLECPDDGDAPLSDRETEIVELLRQGWTLESIANRLCISYHTIHTHTRNIYSKLRVNSRSQAVYKYFNKPHPHL